MKTIQTYCCNLCYTERSHNAREGNAEIKRIEILESEKSKIVCTFCFNNSNALGIVFADYKIETEIQ